MILIYFNFCSWWGSVELLQCGVDA